MSTGWRHADFAALVGQHVTLRAVDGPATGLGLPATVSACSDALVRGDYVSYSVTLVAGPEAPRQQAAFLIETPARDRDPVLLVPLRELGDSVEYEAVFNQSVQSGSGP